MALHRRVTARLAVTLKWPNDTLIDGRKVSGVLIEAAGVHAGDAGRPTADWMVVGIGVNVAHHPTEGVLYPATSLAAEGSAAERDHILGDLTGAFVSLLARWTDEGFSALRSEYLERAHGIGARATVRLSSSADGDLSGVHEGIDADGRLLLRLDDGAVRTISAGDVFFGRSPADAPADERD